MKILYIANYIALLKKLKHKIKLSRINSSIYAKSNKKCFY